MRARFSAELDEAVGRYLPVVQKFNKVALVANIRCMATSLGQLFAEKSGATWLDCSIIALLTVCAMFQIVFLVGAKLRY